MQATLSETTPYLQCSWNLGMADVFPSTSGKAAAAQFLMGRLGAPPEHCRLLVRAPPRSIAWINGTARGCPHQARHAPLV